MPVTGVENGLGKTTWIIWNWYCITKHKKEFGWVWVYVCVCMCVYKRQRKGENPLKGIGTWKTFKEFMLNFVSDVTHNSEFSGTPAWTTLASSPDLKCELPLFPGLTDLTTHIFHWRFVQSGPVLLYQSLGILTDCLRTAEFSQNKHPLAISFLESPTHVCSTNRPHWDGIPVFTSASSDAPARKQAHLQIF